MEFHILGSVELWAKGLPHALGSGKERRMLAALAIDVGRPVPLDTLAHRLWDDHPPARPRENLHTYASRIRRRMREIGGQSAPGITVRTHTYTLEADPGSVDWHRFLHLTTQARSLSDSGDDAQALGILQRADQLWQGEPLAGLTGAWAETVRVTLAEKRLAATLLRITIELRMSRFPDLVGELSSLVDRYPTDETLIGHLMVASYGCGRHSDALRAYESARQRIRTEFGSHPGDALARIHQLILRRVPVIELLPPHPGRTRQEPVLTPHNLPRPTTLVGRADEMQKLQAACREPTHAAAVGSVVTLEAISGMVGSGKTALAVHAAHHLGGHFPDGQIYLDLRGYAPGHEPLSSQAALASLLRILGIPASRIPVGLEELTALWRTMLACRRAVVVLDDAAGPEQVRPLLPGNSASLVIITSRLRLTGLPGVRPVFLDVLTPKDAIAMFQRIIGDQRSEDIKVIGEIVRLCGYLPLAIEIAASRLNARPTWTPSHLAQRLARGHGRLSEIRDGHREIARAFEISYHTLSSEQRQAFRLLSLHFSPELSLHTAAALTGHTLDRTERIIDSLLDRHLLQEPTPDRYRFHDLLGEFARTLTTSEDSGEQRALAVQRLADFYLHAVDRADRLVFPRRLRFDVGPAALPMQLPAWRDTDEAKRWFALERVGVIAAERHCQARGRPRQAALLAHVLAAFLDAEGYWTEADRLHRHAADYWSMTGDQRAEALSQIDLGGAHSHASRYEQAAVAGQRALALARAAGDTDAEAEALHSQGVLHWHLGHLDKALTVQREALNIRLQSGDAWQIARSKNNLAITLLYLGDHPLSQDYFLAALAGFRQMRDAHLESRVLNNLAELFLHMGNHDSARRTLKMSLDISRRSGTRSDQATIQITLASTLGIPEELDAALDLYRDALFTFRRLGDRRNETITLTGIGTAFHMAGHDTEAAAHYSSALELARSIGAAHEETQAQRLLGTTELRMKHLPLAEEHLEASLTLACQIQALEEEARACDTLADLRLQTGNRSQARELWERARTTFDALGLADEAGKIRKKKNKIDRQGTAR